jgi:hypothetical protein
MATASALQTAKLCARAVSLTADAADMSRVAEMLAAELRATTLDAYMQA